MTRKILLVEDEPMVRIISSDTLCDAGYDVLEAANADEALIILETIEGVDLLFTDIRMPGSMDGLALAILVHERWPATKILITSGDTWPAQSKIPDDGRFIAKPYKLEALQHEVDELVWR